MWYFVFPPADESQSHTLFGSSALQKPENESQLFILGVLDNGKKGKTCRAEVL